MIWIHVLWLSNTCEPLVTVRRRKESPKYLENLVLPSTKSAYFIPRFWPSDMIIIQPVGWNWKNGDNHERIPEAAHFACDTAPGTITLGDCTLSGCFQCWWRYAVLGNWALLLSRRSSPKWNVEETYRIQHYISKQLRVKEYRSFGHG